MNDLSEEISYEIYDDDYSRPQGINLYWDNNVVALTVSEVKLLIPVLQRLVENYER